MKLLLISSTLQRTVTVADITSQSSERITAGFSVEVLIECLGGRDELYEDSVRVTLQTGSTTIYLMFPVAVSYVPQNFCLSIYNLTDFEHSN